MTAPLSPTMPTAGVTSPEVAPLVDGGEMAHRLTDAGMPVASLAPTYLRHKPGESTIVGYRASPVDVAATVTPDEATEVPDGTWLHVRWCADRLRADELFAKAVTLRPAHTALGPGAVRVDPWTVAYGFPVDPGLPRLRWWVEARKLKRSLEDFGRERGGVSSRTGVEVLRYKPQRRLVARVDVRTVDGAVAPLLVRYGTGPSGHRLHAVTLALRAAGVRCPNPVFRAEGGRVTVDRFVTGRSLREVVGTDDDNDPDALVDGVVDALWRFHATPVPMADRLTRRLPSVELARASRGLESLGALRPELADLTDRLGRVLVATVPPDPSPDRLRLIHGDLHTGNVVMPVESQGPAGGDASPCFIDLDRVGLGLPVTDLATLLAQGLALPVRQPGRVTDADGFATEVVAAYRHRSSDPSTTDGSLAWHTAVALVDQALLPLRQLAAGGGVAADLILKTAIDVLDCLDPCGVLL